MVKLEVSEPLEGSQKASGTIVKAEIKTITPKSGGDPFPILEFTIGGIQGTIKDVLGNATLTVGLTCNRVTRKSRIGRLAVALFGWDGESQLDTDDFLGTKVDFLVEPQETQNGEFWQVNRDSLSPAGAMENVTVR